MEFTKKMSPGEEFKKYVEGLNVKILDIGQRVGMTDYIDFIKPEEVDSPVMKGKDISRRGFLVIKAIGTTEEGAEIDLFQTFFQRYSNSECLWMGCGHYGHQLFETVGGMNEKHFGGLMDIISGKTITTENFYRCDSYKIRTIRLKK